MKNAAKYEKKVKKLLSSMKRQAPPEPESLDTVRVMLEAVLEADASTSLAERALGSLEKEFVDYNELRVSQLKELAECIGRDHPLAREKAIMISHALNEVFQRANALNTEYMNDMTKRDLRSHLQEIGLSPYAAAYVTLLSFGGHAVPVDDTLVECLEMDEYIHPGSDLADVQGFLERIIPQKNAYSAHLHFRKYVEKSAKALEKKRQAEAKAREEAEAAERAKAEVEAARKAEEEKAKKAKKAKKSKKSRKASRKKATAKKSGKSTKKKATKASKKKRKSAKKTKKAKKSKKAPKSSRKK